MYRTAALTSSSGAAEVPRGGITPVLPWNPLRACSYKVSRPSAIRGAHAALSPNFGAPAMPAPWQTKQVDSKTFLPAAFAAAGVAATLADADTDGATVAFGAGGVAGVAAGAVAVATAGAASGGCAGSSNFAPAALAI